MQQGVVLSVFSSALFAGLYYYAILLHPLDGEQIFGWRMLLTLPCVTVFLIVTGQWHLVRGIADRLRAQPLLAAGLLLSSVLVGSQQWLFLWAPVNGRALQVSLGYFLMPLSMLIIGRLLYGERLTALQTTAACSAFLGVAHELLRVGGFSWEAMAVAIGFPAYFTLRQKLNTDSLGGLWFDMAITLPVAAWFVAGNADALHQFSQTPRLYLLVAGLAIMSAAAFMSYSMANMLLSFSLFGLLSYVEPILMLVVSLLLGERISEGEWFTYAPIWGAVIFLAADGILHLRAERDFKPRPSPL